MTEVEKSRIIITVDNLQKEKTRKENELTRMKSDHSAAWEIYGSKLCAGGMLASEDNLQKEICQLERKITYLKDVLRDNRNLRADLEMLMSKVKELDSQIRYLEIQRMADKATLRWVSFSLKVCNGEQ